MIELLRRRHFDDPIRIAGMIDNVAKLNSPLPEDLRTEFTSEKAHPWVRQAAFECNGAHSANDLMPFAIRPSALDSANSSLRA
jgi:hypothetical protein